MMTAVNSACGAPRLQSATTPAPLPYVGRRPPVMAWSACPRWAATAFIFFLLSMSTLTQSAGFARSSPMKAWSERRTRSTKTTFSRAPANCHYSREVSRSQTNGVRENDSYPGENLSPHSLVFLSEADEIEGSDIDEECIVGDNCFVMHDDTAFKIDSTAPVDKMTQFIDNLLKYIPVGAPIFAFMTYEEIASDFNAVITFFASRNWVAVDGGAYQTQIITPAINGIVVPSISILFATLISNTVTTLRQRHIDIRTALNMEAGEIRVLESMVDSFLPAATDAQDRCREYLIQYTSRLIAECQPGVQIGSLMFTGSTDSEMNGILAQLNQLAVAGGSLPDSLLSESYGAVNRLNAERSARISAMLSTFPTLHYVILTALAGSICTCFLIESDQEVFIFLLGLQLKILWTMLIGTFSALSVVCYDLGDPFRGSYQVRQLESLIDLRVPIHTPYFIQCLSCSSLQI